MSSSALARRRCLSLTMPSIISSGIISNSISRPTAPSLMPRLRFIFALLVGGRMADGESVELACRLYAANMEIVQNR